MRVKPTANNRSPERRARDESIAAEPPLPPPALSPTTAVPRPIQSHLRRARRPVAVAGGGGERCGTAGRPDRAAAGAFGGSSSSPRSRFRDRGAEDSGPPLRSQFPAPQHHPRDLRHGPIPDGGLCRTGRGRRAGACRPRGRCRRRTAGRGGWGRRSGRSAAGTPARRARGRPAVRSTPSVRRRPRGVGPECGRRAAAQRPAGRASSPAAWPNQGVSSPPSASGWRSASSTVTRPPRSRQPTPARAARVDSLAWRASWLPRMKWHPSGHRSRPNVAGIQSDPRPGRPAESPPNRARSASHPGRFGEGGLEELPPHRTEEVRVGEERDRHPVPRPPAAGAA